MSNLGGLMGVMDKNLDVITYVVSLIAKEVIIA